MRAKWKIVRRLEYPPPILESDWKVLDVLADLGPTNAYQIKKKTGKAYSLVFNALRKLERMRKVRLEEKAKTEKNTIANVYDLTLDGVLLLLNKEMRSVDTDRWNRSFVGKIIEKYAYMLPLVFGKWRHFERIGLGKIFLTRIKIIVDTHESHPFRKGTGFYRWLETKEQVTRFFFLFDYSRLENHFIPNFDTKAWLTALKQDEEMRNYIIKELEYEQRSLKNMQNRVKEIFLFLGSKTEEKRTSC